MNDKKMFELSALMLKLYRFRSPSDIDRMADAVLAIIDDTILPAPEAGIPVSLTESATVPDEPEAAPSGAGLSDMSDALRKLLDILRPMTDQQLEGVAGLVSGASRLDQIARLVDLELSGMPHNIPEFDKLAGVQTMLTEIRAHKAKKSGESQVDKFNARYGKR